MIEPGKTVKVHYKGSLEDGTIFDTTQGREPLEFEVGAGQVIPGFDAAVRKLEEGKTEKVTIPSAEAYGEKRQDLIATLAHSQLPEDLEPEVGLTLQLKTPQGALPVRVIGIGEEGVTIDGNHPLAGQDLTFEMTVVEVG